MTTAVEPARALFLNRLEEELPDGFSRLYFGAEFCPWRLPTCAAIAEALAAARRAGWSFTLALPILAESVLAPLEGTLEKILPTFSSSDEVLVSDWGALALVRRHAPGVPVILGRTLSGQKRGPEILSLQTTPAQRDYFRRGSWYGRESRQLLAEEGIARIELDNLLQGVAPLPAGLAGSLHVPFAMVTSSRNCPWREAGIAGGCLAPCGEVFTLHSERYPIPLLQGGNTQFLRNEILPADLRELGIDRLVQHLRLPG